MSAFTQPLLMGSDKTSILLERIPLTGAGEGRVSEGWLQQALFAAPESLPIREIDPHIGPLIPVCMELETGAGPADVLYVTPTGKVVLVETKLWRNPEARREVVGQILDYAKQLTTWTYEVLDQKAAMAAGADKGFLLERLRKHAPEADETAFVDGVARSLQAGDFLLLIVGDGIRHGAESLVAFLERFGHLRFAFGLIEVAGYRVPGGQTLLLPRILAKTEILQRTLFMGPSGPVSFQEAAQAEETTSASASLRDWFASFWKEFLTKLELDDPSLKPTEPAKSTNQFFWMPPGGGRAWISAYVAQSTGKAGVYLAFSKSYDLAREVLEALEADRDAIEREFGAPLNWERIGDKLHLSAPTVSFSNLNAPADRDRVTSYLADTTERMVRTMKPRLEAAAREPGDG